MNKKILVAIPMYNCEKQISRVIDKFDDSVRKYLNDILIIDNGSKDNSLSVCKRLSEDRTQLNITVVRNVENYNLGGSHKVAFNYAIQHGYDYVLILHGDDQGDIRDMLPSLQNEEYQNYDCLLGARFMKGSNLVNYSSIRTYGNRVFNLFFSLVSGRKIYDLGAGLNLYSTRFLQDGFYLRFPNKLTFNYYMLLYTIESRASFKFFPLSWKEEDQVSNVRFFPQTRELLKILVCYLFSRKRFLNKKRETLVAYDFEIIKNSEG